MHLQTVIRAQFRRQFVNRQIRLGRNPTMHPVLDAAELPTTGIALRLWRKRPGLALEPDHFVHELDRYAQTSCCLGVRVALLDKRHHPCPQLNRMRFTHV